MNASDWEKAGRKKAVEEAVELALPSGMVIRARRPDPVQVAMWGRLPLRLAGMVQGEDGRPGLPADETVVAAVELAREVLVYCCVTPRITLTPAGPDEIHPSHVPMDDVLFILRWARREEETETLRSFRGGSATAVSGIHGEGVRAAAERDAGDRGPGDGAGTGSGGGDGVEFARTF